jgi:putative photosynthetic complex assembly protein
MARAVRTPRIDPFPRPVLWAAGALLSFTIIVSAIGRWEKTTDVPAGGAIRVERNLIFADQPNGDVAITDANTGVLVETVSGQAGFLRATMRGLATDRLRYGKGQSLPFRLTAYKDGRLTIDDPVTGRHVELEAFGHTNEGVFAALVDLKPIHKAGDFP